LLWNSPNTKGLHKFYQKPYKFPPLEKCETHGHNQGLRSQASSIEKSRGMNQDTMQMAAKSTSAMAKSQNGTYYKNSREEMVAFLPANPNRLVDIGCGEGYFGVTVKARFPGCEIWGVEPVAAAAAIAAARYDRVINSTLETAADLPDGYFDVVMMNDVLEHILWPEASLATVHRILRPGGKLVLSLPNAQFLLNVLDLVKRNEWEYTDCGILDRTHFRFYTTKSAKRLLERNRFQVEQIVGINPMRPRWYYRFVFAMAPKYFYWMPFYQFAVVARPISE
jgi:SAM-dependent methyltransferase